MTAAPARPLTPAELDNVKVLADVGRHLSPLMFWIRLALALDGLGSGAGYLFGPGTWSSSPALAQVRALGVPIRVWGAVFMVAGLLVLLPNNYRAWGYGLGVGVYAFWGACVAASAHGRLFTAWGGMVHLFTLAGIHGAAMLTVVSWGRVSNRVTSRRG